MMVAQMHKNYLMLTSLISILGRQIINLSIVKKKERPTKNKRQTNKGYVILETHTKIFLGSFK
jgi:hypothetical protein